MDSWLDRLGAVQDEIMFDLLSRPATERCLNIRDALRDLAAARSSLLKAKGLNHV